MAGGVKNSRSKESEKLHSYSLVQSVIAPPTFSSQLYLKQNSLVSIIFFPNMVSNVWKAI